MTSLFLFAFSFMWLFLNVANSFQFLLNFWLFGCTIYLDWCTLDSFMLMYKAHQQEFANTWNALRKCILCSSAFSSYILKKYFKIKCTCMHLTSLLDQHKIFFQNTFIDAWAIWPKNSTDLENQLIWTKLLFAMVKIHCTRFYIK